MKKLQVFLVFAVTVALSACATNNPALSYVSADITTADAEALSSDTVNFLSDQLAPAHTTLVLNVPKTNGTKKENQDQLTPALIGKLQARGYGVAVINDDETPRPAGTQLRYLASPLENGVVVRLQYIRKEATRFYYRDSAGALVPGGSFSIRDGSEK